MGTFDFDVAVIGGGSAGYATARTTAAAGQRTVVIEAGEELGGLCILRGCMPTKALLHAADVRHQARRSKLWGLEPGEVGFDFPAVMRRKAAMVEEFASYRRSQLQDGRFELIRALARFRDPHTLELDNGQTVTAGNIMISTGSRVADLPMPGLAKLGCMTSDDALRHESLPQSIIVLGGGAVAVEFAQFFARSMPGCRCSSAAHTFSRRVTTMSPAKLKPPFAMRGSPSTPAARLSTRGRTTTKN